MADRSGASVIIGAKDGKLQVESENQCRGFGFGWQPLNAALAKGPKPIVADALKILSDCRQSGEYATKYSNFFDLKSGENSRGSLYSGFLFQAISQNVLMGFGGPGPNTFPWPMFDVNYTVVPEPEVPTLPLLSATLLICRRFRPVTRLYSSG